MYSIKVKANIRGYETEFTFSHDDPDIFYRKMFSLFEWVKSENREQPVENPFRLSNDILTGTRRCPKHDILMKSSKHNKGFWYCPAIDEQGTNGYCDIQMKMNPQETELFA